MFNSTSQIVITTNVGLVDLVVNIINWLIQFTAVLAVIMIIVAGFQYIVSMGDKEKIGKATSALVFALVGMVLAFMAPNVIQYILDNFLGI